ncbi:signal recognition particle protein [Candidatus Babeliales bacterium]|nr:signal recognition particle protein [Candidatus Babeliales bacterium]
MFDFLSNKLSKAFTYIEGKKTLSAEDVKQIVKALREAFLEADVPFKTTELFLNSIREKALNTKKAETVSAQDHVSTIVYQDLVKLLEGKTKPSEQMLSKNSIIMMMGLQGAGKTTSVAKLAHFLMQQNNAKNRILATSVDFARPAAVDQLRGLAKQTGFDFSEPVINDVIKTVKKTKELFISNPYTHLFIDTPGRLHINNKLMEELKTLNSYLAPTHTILVLDAMTGQESINVARAFDQAIGISGALLSKMDSDARGGASLAFAHEVQKPIMFIGTGEKTDELEPFVPKRIAGRIMGSGDIETLAERVERTLNNEQKANQENTIKRLMNGTATLEDFAYQMSAMTSLGSVSKLMSYLPGAQSVSKEQLAQGEKEINSFKAIISSMTLKERKFPGILNTSRKRRIAHGSGSSVGDVNRLIQKFEESKRFAKMLSSMGGLGDLMSRGP